MRSTRPSAGQALVEFALVLPVLMFLLLVFAEIAVITQVRQSYQNGVDVLAQWAAGEMASSPGESWQAGWSDVVRDEATRTGCDDLAPSVSFPDGTHAWGDRVVVVWRCYYTPRVVPGWGGFPVTVQSAAVVPGAAPPPAPSPSPS